MSKVIGHSAATLLAIALVAGAPAGRPARSSHHTDDERAVARFVEAVRDYNEFGRNGPVLTTDAAEALRFRLRFARWLYRHNPVEALGDEMAPAHADSRHWPSVLDALPPLPERLEYRPHGRHLLLVDRRTRMVIDVLADAW
jgi:hypothetical protein